MEAGNLILRKPDRTVNTTIKLTGSKSECNRALVIAALSKGKVKVENLSEAADTVTLARVLEEVKGGKVKGERQKLATGNPQLTTVNIGPAGTAMRFLTAFFTLQKQHQVVLTGSERMKQRPIGILVDALRTLGARDFARGKRRFSTNQHYRRI